jgi:hypothetical protein
MTGLWMELERDALYELARAWRTINWTYLRDALRPPSFELHAGESTLGRWYRERRLITLSRKLVFEHSWGVVEEVLKHEMAHQFADEVWNAHDETAHGFGFRAACERLAIDPAASGLPEEAPLADDEQRMIQKIARLLSLASSPNQHEAEAATLAARRLMHKHNVDAQSSRRAYTFKHLGKPVRRLEESARVLGRILGDHFFVEVIWVRAYQPLDRIQGTVMEVVGTPSNLAIAEYVYAYLTHAAAELWAAHQDGKKAAGRLRFQAGVMHGFLDKLERDKKQPEEQALVWIKDGELDAFYRRRHPRITTFRREGNTRDKTFEHGRKAGEKIVLKRGLESTGSSRGRLLGPGSGSGS